MNRRIWLAPGQYPRVDKNFARLILFLRIENSDRKHSIDRVEIYQYHMARIYILESFQNSALVGAEKKRANSIQVVVIGRDFPSSHGTMHPVAQFNITYAYSIVSRRRRRNRKGLCTPARFARDAQEGQKLVLHSNFLSPIPLLWKLPREQPSFHQVALLDDYAAIYRDLSRHGLPAELATLVSHAVDRVGGYTHFRHPEFAWSLFESGVNFEKFCMYIKGENLSVNFIPSFVPFFRINWGVENVTSIKRDKQISSGWNIFEAFLSSATWTGENRETFFGFPWNRLFRREREKGTSGWGNNILIRGTRGIEEKFRREWGRDEDEAFSNFSLYPFIPTSSAGTRQWMDVKNAAINSAPWGTKA